MIITMNKTGSEMGQKTTATNATGSSIIFGDDIRTMTKTDTIHNMMKVFKSVFLCCFGCPNTAI